MTGRTAVVLFTRDLRVHDHPALAAACSAFDRVVPLYVLDPALQELSANRTRFLHQSLADLREALRERGGDLVVRRGDPAAETMKLARKVGAREDWRDHAHALDAWTEGRTGMPIVDAGSRERAGGSADASSAHDHERRRRGPYSASQARLVGNCR